MQEILPPESDNLAIPARAGTISAVWQRSTQTQKSALFLLSGSFIVSVFMFALGQFFQIRGVQHLLTSRIFLGIAGLSAALLVWAILWTARPNRWMRLGLTGTILITIACIALDRKFPMMSVKPSATVGKSPDNLQDKPVAPAPQHIPSAAEIADELSKKIINRPSRPSSTSKICTTDNNLVDCTDQQIIDGMMQLRERISAITVKRVNDSQSQLPGQSEGFKQSLVKWAISKAGRAFNECCFKDSIIYRREAIRRLGPGFRDEDNDRHYLENQPAELLAYSAIYIGWDLQELADKLSNKVKQEMK